MTLTVTNSGNGTVTSSPAGITCGSACTLTVDPGTLVTLTATPDTGAVFTGWTGGGCSGTSSCTLKVDADTTVEAAFATAQVTVAVTPAGDGTGTVTSSPLGIDCGSACSSKFDAGTAVTLSAAPAADSVFVGWTGAGCSGTGACMFAATSDTNVTATFALPVPLAVTLAGNGTGTVTSDDGNISCGTTCSHAYAPDTMVTLTAAPGAESVFAGWSGGGCSGTSPCTVTVSAATQVTATFDLVQYPLTVSKAGTGAGTVTSTPAGISCGSSCSASFDSGTMVTLTATPVMGSTFAGWSGAGCSGTGSCTVTMTAAASVTATFTLDTETLTVARAGNGSGTVTSMPAGITCGTSCSSGYPYGTSITLTPTPGTGSTFAGWSGGGCSGTGPCTVMITASTTVTATFSLQRLDVTLATAGTGTGTVAIAPVGTSCGTSCYTYNYGTAITVTATPAADAKFSGFSGGGCSAANPCNTTVTAAATITTTFTRTQYPLTVTMAGAGTGNVTSNPTGINCPGTCSATYATNTSVALTATPDPAGGSFFAGWSGGCSGPGACTVTMNAMQDVTATFKKVLWPDEVTKQCYDVTMNYFGGCPGNPTGQDGDYQINVPTYTTTTDTVTDNVTGLMWQRTPDTTYVSWSSADSYCSGLGLDGYTDWRLPTIVELVSIMDAGRSSAPFATVFSGLPQNSFVWTSTVYSVNTTEHVTIATNWSVTYVGLDTDTTAEFPICVRGGGFVGSLTASNNSVTDARTGLVWQSTAAGSQMSWADAINYCENLTLDGASNWRLPNIKELYSIVDYTTNTPAISSVFASRLSSVYWSSTPAAASGAYAVNFKYGIAQSIDNPYTTLYDVRCVR